MFGGKEDKVNLKEASLTAVQGFPEDANTKTIYDIVAELRAEDSKKDRRTIKGVFSEQA
jgi:pantothenate kinase